MPEFGGLWKHSNNPACTKTYDNNGQIYIKRKKTENFKKQPQTEPDDLVSFLAFGL